MNSARKYKTWVSVSEDKMVTHSQNSYSARSACRAFLHACRLLRQSRAGQEHREPRVFVSGTPRPRGAELPVNCDAGAMDEMDSTANRPCRTIRRVGMTCHGSGSACAFRVFP